MIQEHFDMTFTEKLALIGQVLAKVGANFWPMILLAVLAGIIIHKQETAGRGYGGRR